MSQPTSFLVIVIGGWVVLRAATASIYPGAFAKPVDRPTLIAGAKSDAPTAKPQTQARTVYVPYPVYIDRPAASAPSPALAALARPARDLQPAASPPPSTRPVAPMRWSLSAGGRPYSIVGVAMPPPRPGPATPGAPSIAPPAFDRWQLTGWGLFRDDAPNQSLAPTGTLAGSQAGMRLTYRLDENFAIAARASAPANSSIEGGEAALGIRYTPFADIPLSLTAERRQRLGNSGGRNDFALVAEGGIWGQPVALDLAANAYLQAGMVGIEERDLFVDGALTLTRPLIAKIDGGIGVWGGAQPGLSRLDLGPRLSMPLYDGVKLHLDWRQQVAGEADPGSGPVVSIGADL